MWKEASWPNFRYNPSNWLKGLRKTKQNKKNSFRITNLQVEILTTDLPNVKQDCYSLAAMFSLYAYQIYRIVPPFTDND